MRPVTSIAETSTQVCQKLQHGGLVLGFSGYASDGYPYEIEAEGIERVLERVRKTSPIDLVVDGGTSLGATGLSGAIAEKKQIDTLGIVPLEGLRSLGPRTNILVVGKQYGDETELMGTIPDMLVVVGGGPNAAKEYQAALRVGSTVGIMRLKDYPPNSLSNTYPNLPETSRAREQGRLVVCNNLEEIDRLADLPVDRLHAGRLQRRQKITNLLQG